jgi:hypothetical protein
MDVLNEKEIASVVVNPAIDRLKAEIIPALRLVTRMHPPPCRATERSPW